MRSSCKALSQLVIMGEGQAYVGGAIPGLLSLGSIGRLVEQAMISKLVHTVLCGLCTSSCLRDAALLELPS